MTDNSITHQTTGQTANPTAQEDGPEPINQNQFVDYALLLKPRVMSLVLFTGVAGMLLAPGKLISLPPLSPSCVSPWVQAHPEPSTCGTTETLIV